MPGTSYLLVVRQLSEGVKYRLVNPEDGRLREALIGLRDLLIAYLGETAPAREGAIVSSRN